MSKQYKLGWWMAAALFFVLIGGGVWLDKSGGKVEVDTGKVVVGASIFPVADLVRQVGGEWVTVIELVPPGFSPHSYSLLPGQVADLQSAEVIFSIGHGLDDAVVDVVQDSVGAEVVWLDNGINLLAFGEGDEGYDEHGEGSIDPHYWLDVKNAQIMTRTIAEELIKIDVDHADEYVENAVKYEAKLRDLEDRLQQQVEDIDQAQVMTMHGGWAYFARAYGLEVVATYEPIEGKQPTVADLRDIKAIIDQFGLDKFYTEPQKATTGVVRFMEDEFGLGVRILDPIGGSDGINSYEELMSRNVRAVARK